MEIPAKALELTDAGFDASVLSECRTRLIAHQAEERLLEKMLTVFEKKGWLKARGKQRTDSTHVLGKIRALNRVLCVWETMRAALNSLAVAAPDWLRTHAHEEWVERYGPRSEDSRCSSSHRTQVKTISRVAMVRSYAGRDVSRFRLP